MPTTQYEDEDRDKVVLSSDSDLIAAVDHARKIGWKVMSFPKQRRAFGCSPAKKKMLIDASLFAEHKVASGLRRRWPAEGRGWSFGLGVRWQGRSMGFCVQRGRGRGGSGCWARRDGLLETVRVIA